MFKPPVQAALPKTKERKCVSNSTQEGRPTSRRKRSNDLSSNASDEEALSPRADDDDVEQDNLEVQRQNRLLTTTKVRTLSAFLSMNNRLVAQFCLDRLQCYESQVSRSTINEGDMPSVNMTDFSRKNCIQPVAKDPTYMELFEALGNLRQFGESFYNESTVEVLRAVELWGGVVLADRLSTVLLVKDELFLHTPFLPELLYEQQKDIMAALKTQLEVKTSVASGGYSSSRDFRSTSKPKGTPKEVLRVLPKQGSLTLCMKYLW
ncbi:hypothetical protein JG688_00009551 [Phytophthora aleatoria]|uniref:Uncharacterized protein n=1 Tax=Phytophthora aleatoria TaxID=2496075 RepID=A0A8J5M2C4_9STRA|nr:hypothetical protein JG688_00009551 [Phytophthora aleatoria]